MNLAAVRCLLGSTTGSDVTANIPRAKVPRRSPKILSGAEVVRLLAATDSPNYLAIFKQNGVKVRSRIGDRSSAAEMTR